MSHVAISGGDPVTGAQTMWAEHVSDQDYRTDPEPGRLIRPGAPRSGREASRQALGNGLGEPECVIRVVPALDRRQPGEVRPVVCGLPVP